MIEKIFHSAQDMQAFSYQIAQAAKTGMVFALIGNLGTGKTTFSQGFARGLGINTRVGSPTFKLVSEYSGNNIKMNHVDCYRLKDFSDFLNIGGENLLYPENGVTLIEWAEIIEQILPPDNIRINFSRVEGQSNHRKIKIIGLEP